MSFTGFAITSSALDAYQQAENIVSNDIANVNTPGASEQQAQLTESVPLTAVPGMNEQTKPGTIGTGVTVTSILRLHDNSLDALYRAANSSQNYYSTQNTVLTTLQSALSEPSGGVTTAYNNFQTAVSQLASETAGSSSDSTNRQAFFQAAQTLTSTLNSASTAITKQESTVTSQAGSAVQSANSLIDKIAVLNGEIRASSAAGDNPNTYLDQRDTLIDQLSAILPVQVVNETNGSTLITVGGDAVVNDTKTYHLSGPSVVTASNGMPQLVVGMANDPNPTNPKPVTLGSGSLGGYLDLYNNGLSSYMNSLNSFASSLSTQFNDMNASGYDEIGAQGGDIFTSTASGNAVTAADIGVAISSISQIATSTASTAAGSLVQPMNASNTNVTTATTFDGNDILANPPPAIVGLSGTLTIKVDGVTVAPPYAYNTATTDTSAGAFINNFNALQVGVTASFDQGSQSIVFTRDPSNESQAFQATAGYTPSASFTITDSNGALGSAVGAQPVSGAPAISLLQVLGAGKINGITQDSTNAYGADGNANAIAFQNLFNKDVGVPPVTNHTNAVITVPPGTPQTVPLTAAIGNIVVGQTLTIDPGQSGQENVLVTAIDGTSNPPTFTATFANSHPAGAAIVSEASETLGEYYQNFMTKVGFDGQTAATGQTTQTNLATTLQTQRSNTDGINLDQETQDLIQFQTAYAAAAKTFSVLQSLLTAVMDSVA